MKKVYRIPEDSEFVTAEVTDNSIVLLFEPKATKAFLCDITNDLEYMPNLGDLSIFWSQERPGAAIVARLSDYNFSEKESLFKSSNGLWYHHAIRFRNEEQYNKIISHGRETQSEKEA
ncbi:hypothetical protein HMPREF1214_02831 [Bacteroides sp. HPS0048]|uniref:hypothetical protein n=1 Tax=Bacteroides sp. HPS0048 TaxID=1078089 RepID=UPI000376EE01|nr:hypothetical protein [Bacteroides sp. HPS0048]EOA57317.1 hypothetical protein HMPREF1214_02831 [Bacteroides sp. HPS0048]